MLIKMLYLCSHLKSLPPTIDLTPPLTSRSMKTCSFTHLSVDHLKLTLFPWLSIAAPIFILNTLKEHTVIL